MGSKIVKIASHLPEKVISNIDLARETSRWKPEKIESKLGIRERHVAAENETAGDLAFKAAEIVLENYEKSKIDMLIFCTQSPDYFLPATACILHKKLNLQKNVGAFDFNQGCSGYIYGLALAKAIVNSKIANSVLFIVGETYSKHIHPKDLANRTIFGDAAAATIIEKCDQEHIHEFILGTDGAGKDNLIVPNGCFRSERDKNAEEITNDAGDIYTSNNLYMNGPEIFNFTIEAVPQAVNDCLLKNSMTLEEIDYVIFHQANNFMIEYLREKIDIPHEKFYSNMLLTGNTVSATIPIAIEDSLNRGVIKSGDKVLLCGFGVGYSWGAVIIEV
ncbi:MAG: 3-oxoacyl-ACP synthase [Flavobacterium sp.]|nr:3-oxoacyl-ACP synthase [Flavobacterium sp.]